MAVTRKAQQISTTVIVKLTLYDNIGDICITSMINSYLVVYRIVVRLLSSDLQCLFNHSSAQTLEQRFGFGSVCV